MAPYLHFINKVCSSWHGNRHTLTHKTTTVPLAHALRVNNINFVSVVTMEALYKSCTRLHQHPSLQTLMTSVMTP